MSAKFTTEMLLLSCCLSVLASCALAHPRYVSRDSKHRGRFFDLEGAASETRLAYAGRPQQPLQLNDNYNLIMPDYYDHHPAESMQLQNFADFHDVQVAPENDLGMDESQHQQFLQSTPVRAPMPLSAEEQRIRQHVEPVDPKREKKMMLKLKKGNTKPRGPEYQQWDQFDYDLYSANPGDSKKYNHAG
ncbi:uncharacterized protein LOC115620356 [Scaptodrosophila lebanonensis]|uniref:Uncharacterized protein LOC115620356 n=1 Tax=Drosophila lebanonensis TaxID=7225 RepID=A0A6J2T000_DROLE|nr:uncharacterized protein LOC115620356 [Scaptodrosophila lebanonensis]